MGKPLAVITAAPSWAQEAAAILTTLGFDVAYRHERAGYTAWLADHHAALVLVNGDAEDWRFWSAAPKASAATRRIPLVLIAEDAAVRAQAQAAGADFTLAPQGLAVRLPVIASQHAYPLDSEAQQRLTDQCADPLPPQAREALEQFNAGEYYKQHDLLEALWMAEPGPLRHLYQAILQVGIACYQVTRGNRRGALKMLRRSLRRLALLPDVCCGIDVARLRADALRLRDALQAFPTESDLRTFDRSLLCRVHGVGDPPPPASP